MSNASFTRYTVTVGLSFPEDSQFAGTAVPVADARDWVVWALEHWGLDGATIRYTVGVWKGDTEDSLEIVVLSQDEADESRVRSLAVSYKETFQQQAVMLQTETVPVDFI